ncbi:TetR/AcrR family transcriptional regulator [Kineococcus indalonis]|uniref:TetR/AcrR family transcriptional regulator n=1 Tax=Kineococcus indalonis TaxID=2696566 RepID=UPI0014134533|nr:TetR/AcrR family transcriptional regulator [Kineococcus indalonis]NAZ84752.1 TetR family transcriptional regulator [Kineococcus indalonis]
MAGKEQFDVDTALDAAMLQFWRAGYADTPIDDLSRATGLNRSSIHSSFGDKDTLSLRCLDRYATRYGQQYDAALSCAACDPLAAVRAFFTVTLERVADPQLPDGCLIAQSVMAIPVLSPAAAQQARQSLGLQRLRRRAALEAARMSDVEAGAFAVHAAAVNQSLAVMSRAGASPAELLAVVGVTVAALSKVLPARE